MTGDTRDKSMISISKLRAFAAVAEYSSFTVAARAAGMSAAALSARVTELEKLLGVTLLQRTTRRVDLTGEGQRLFDRAKRVLADLDSITEDLSSEGRLQGGRIVVSCVPTLAGILVADVMSQFAVMYPKVVIHLIDEATVSMRERVLKDEADFGIGPNPGADLQFERLASDPFVLTCRTNDPLAKREFLTGLDLAELPLITLARGSNVRDVLDTYFEKQGIVFRPRFEVQHHYTLGALVDAGLGYGPLPSLALRLIGEHGLTSIPIRRPVCERAIGIITRSGNRLSPAADAFLNVIRPVFRGGAGNTRRKNV
jgi:DNA-binding transcriptional LysR family regulator